MILDVKSIGTLAIDIGAKIVKAAVRDNIRNKKGKSISREAGRSSIIFPLIASSDLSKDVVMDIAKSNEVKLAYEIKKLIERDIKNGSDSTSYDRMLKDLPYSNVFNKGIVDLSTIENELMGSYNKLEGKATSSLKTLFGEAIVETRNISKLWVESVMLDQKFEDEENKTNLYGEAKSLVIKERSATPTIIDVELKYSITSGDIKTIKYQISIECVPRFVDVKILQKKISAYDSRNFLRKYAALTRKELLFFKDFLFDINNIKAMAKNNALNGGKDIFSLIEKHHKLSEAGNSIAAFTCLAFSKPFTDDLLNFERLNIYSEWKMILDKFFAMGLFIYNPETNLLEVVYDGETEITTYPFDDYATDTSKVEKELKNIIRMNR